MMIQFHPSPFAEKGDDRPRWRRLSDSYKPLPARPWWQFSLLDVFVLLSGVALLAAGTGQLGPTFVWVYCVFFLPFVVVPLAARFRFRVRLRAVGLVMAWLIVAYIFVQALLLPTVH